MASMKKSPSSLRISRLRTVSHFSMPALLLMSPAATFCFSSDDPEDEDGDDDGDDDDAEGDDEA